MAGENILELRKFLVPEFVYGEGAMKLAGRYAKNFGAKKVLIVTDSGLIENGWVKIVEEVLKEEDIAYVIFDKVTPNPKDYEVMEGSKYYLENECDVILAVGGGSPMDCAKGIGIVSTNNKHILEFEGVDEVPVPGPPLVCIPTTAGSSADVSQFAIINDTGRKTKIAIISKTAVPDVSLIDPLTTTTMPSELTMATGIDALVHAFEAYVSNASSPITDIVALEAIRLVFGNLINAINYPNDINYRNNMMLGSLYAGMAFSNASLGLVHGMAHSLGGLFNAPHGLCNAILLEWVVDYNFDSAAWKYSQIAKAVGIDIESIKMEDLKLELLNSIRSLKNSAGLDYSLSKLGVTVNDLDNLAKNALNDACLATNPRKPDLEGIRKIYENAL
jgi:alcohol dehydrogenase class IV